MKPIVYNGNYIVNEQQMDFENPVEIHFTRFGNNQRPLNGKSFDIKFSENTFKVFCILMNRLLLKTQKQQKM